MNTADMTQKLWKAAADLRGKVDFGAYPRIILAMLVLKRLPDHLDILTVPQELRWDRLLAAASPRDALDEAVTALAASNPDIIDSSFRNLVRDSRVSDLEAGQLIAILNEILPAGENEPHEATAQIYEQVLDRFADESRSGEGGTPRSMVQLMVRLADPQTGNSVYDPCTRNGDLPIGADAYVAERTGLHGTLRLFAQAMREPAGTVARLNLMLHGISNASVLVGNAITDPRYISAAGDLERFDRVLSNPPLGMRVETEGVKIPQHTRYGLSRVADLMFVQHALASLAPDGVGVVVVPNGVLFRGGAEGRIRQGMLEDGRIAAVIALGRNLFPGTSVPFSVLVLRGEGAARASERDVLLINAEAEVHTMRARNILAPRHAEKIAKVFHQRSEVPNFSRLVPYEEIASKDFTLNSASYIEHGPQARTTANVNALLAGGVPIGEVEAQTDQFAVLGINPTEFLQPGRPGYLEFPEYLHENVAGAIAAMAAPSTTAFVAAVGVWFEDFRQELDTVDDRPLAVVREHFAEEFRDALAASTVQDDEKLVGLFLDWWVTNQDDLDRLRKPAGSRGAFPPNARATTVDRVRRDLAARAKRLMAQEQEQLADICQVWADRYKASLADLEDRRVEVSRRLTQRLHDLGYS
ncbi:N-6 DNA methylase [Actinoplanes missouriensis]|uniref:type I restriction-modification system subunit M n=1 Tax=Actinoplanes missouriensis TaxID=1866 RepID=UPI0033F8362A